ncbi:MAG: LysE family transporter [Flavobacterium sp.]
MTFDFIMSVFIPFLSGFFAAVIGILPPGLLNITAAKIGVKESKAQAVSFAMGASIIVLLQAIIALFFANYINSRPDVVVNLEIVGFFIFMSLSVFFFATAKKSKKVKKGHKTKNKSNRFFWGMLLSGLNLFPIPYYVFVGITVSSYGYFLFNKINGSSFVSGVFGGSFLIFYLYILFFKKSEKKSNFLSDNGNYIVATITALVSVMTLFKLLK